MKNYKQQPISLRYAALLCTIVFSLIVMPNAYAKNGASVAGATVKIKAMDGKVLFETKSDNEGKFTIPSLQPGGINIVVEKAGYEKKKSIRFELQLSSETFFFVNSLKPITTTNASGATIYMWKFFMQSGMGLLLPPVTKQAMNVEGRVVETENPR